MTEEKKVREGRGLRETDEQAVALEERDREEETGEAGQLASDDEVIDPKLKIMAQAGLSYGHKKSKTHPRMKYFVAANRNGIEIIDLVKTAKRMEAARNFLQSLVAAEKKILWVATQPAAREVIKKIAEELDHPYVISKWVGGALTNFNMVRKRVNYYRKLKEEMNSEAVRKYTKKERAVLGKELERMEFLFEGILGMEEIPSALFIVDVKIHETARREARSMGLPVAALISTDTDPSLVKYPIPANNGARAAVEFVINNFREKIREGKIQN